LLRLWRRSRYFSLGTLADFPSAQAKNALLVSVSVVGVVLGLLLLGSIFLWFYLLLIDFNVA
jgi:hypothetical protein